MFNTKHFLEEEIFGFDIFKCFVKTPSISLHLERTQRAIWSQTVKTGCTNWEKKLWIFGKTIDAHIVASSEGSYLFFSLAKQFVQLSLLYPSMGTGNVVFPFSFAIRFNLAFSPQAASSIFHLPLSSPPVFPSISLCPYSITSYLFHHLAMVLSSTRWDKSLTSGQINRPPFTCSDVVTHHIANIWLQSSITLGDAVCNSLEESRTHSGISL